MRVLGSACLRMLQDAAGHVARRGPFESGGRSRRRFTLLEGSTARKRYWKFERQVDTG
jgi:hypothetical protein